MKRRMMWGVRSPAGETAWLNDKRVDAETAKRNMEGGEGDIVRVAFFHNHRTWLPGQCR